MDTMEAFFLKSGHFSWFSKTGKGGLPYSPPSCAPVSVVEYVPISLNIPQYPSKSFYMFGRLLNMPRALNIGFELWHGCIYKGYTDFWIYLNMTHRLPNSVTKYIGNKMLRRFQNFSVCLGNTSAKKLPTTQQKPLYIAAAMALGYLCDQNIAAHENLGN